MRILRLDLRAFGPFTDTTLDLSAGAPGGLHVIYGPNEAGKSSALRAVRDLFYGFEHRTPDAHLHKNEDLRIGGLLAGPGGELYIQRVKRRKDSLLDADGAPFDEARLRRLLGGVDRETFTRSFGLDHAELEAHGERMLKGASSIGETLFDAGTGGVDVRRLLETLRAEQEKLYRPRGKQEINRLLEEHAEARRRSQDVWLLPESFQEQQAKLEAARADVARVSERVDAARTEQYRLRDLQKALPALQRRAACLAEKAALGDVRFVSEAAAERRERAETLASLGRANVARLTDELARATERLSELEVPTALLAIGQARVTRLSDAPGRTRKAREDLPRREAELFALEHEARSSLRRLGRGEERVTAEAMRLSAAERGRIRELSTARDKLDEQRRAACERGAELRRALDERRARLARLAQPTQSQGFARVASLARSLGDVETPLAKLSAREAELTALAEAGLAELRPACSSLAALAELPVPSLERVSALAEEARVLAAREATLAEQRRRSAEQAVEAKAAIARAHAGGEVPSEADLAVARAERQLAVDGALAAWRASSAYDAEQAACIVQAVERADQLADRLRREADRVAALGHAQADEALVLAHVARLAAEQAELSSQTEAHQARHAEAWQKTGLAPGAPVEMSAWLTRRARVLELWQQARSLAPELERARERVLRLEGAVVSVLGASEPGDTLSLRVERCAELEAEQARGANERSELEHGIDADEARLGHERRELERAEQALATWRAAWAVAVQPLGAAPDLPPVAALELLDEMATLASLLEKIEGLERRVNGIRRDEAALGTEVVELANEHGIPFDPKAPDAAAEAIVERFRRGESARDERTRILKENADREAALAVERAALAEAERELAELAREVGLTDPSELSALEAKSRRARELEARLSDLESTLVDDSGGRSVAALVAEAEGEDAPRLSARLEALARELEELEEERARAVTLVASILAGQHRQTDALGAEAAQEEQTLGAALGDRVQRYSTLRVATALLEGAVERYRVENQGPILKRAGELFPRLTDERYLSLRVGRDERGIVAVRADGAELTPPELSTGTRYQLYLALRLASVERFIEGSEPLPLVLDDVTVHVDEARKARTFAVLAEMAARVQILFFTHHARDAELAAAASVASTSSRGAAVLHELTRNHRERMPEIVASANERAGETAGLDQRETVGLDQSEAVSPPRARAEAVKDAQGRLF